MSQAKEPTPKSVCIKKHGDPFTVLYWAVIFFSPRVACRQVSTCTKYRLQAIFHHQHRTSPPQRSDAERGRDGSGKPLRVPSTASRKPTGAGRQATAGNGVRKQARQPTEQRP